MLTDPFSVLGVAFQPIANLATGQCFGYEVLVTGAERLDYASTEAMFDAFHQTGQLGALEINVRGQALALAGALPSMAERTLFFNLDWRIGDALDAVLDATSPLRGTAAQIVTEIAARPSLELDWLRALRGRGGILAADRVGATADGLHLLSACDPDFMKIDRSLIKAIDINARNRVVVSQLIAMGHSLGLQVIAVGVENARECLICRDLGCDLVQGQFIHGPSDQPASLTDDFVRLRAVARDDRRRREIDQRWVLQQLEPIPAISVDMPLNKVFERVARSPDETFVPVVDQLGQPLGIVRERNMKNFAYSAFGKDLIANKALGRTLRDFLVRCPVADIATSLDQMLAVYSTVSDADCILVTEQMVYRGALSARSIIRAMHEKTLARAQDENPLSKLPGNAMINDYLGSCLGGETDVVLAYVDFDNFKPFNDTYGFRQGDRAILLFTELMRKAANPQSWFLGHIGGDDFFIGLASVTADEAAGLVGDLIGRFASDAASFYDTETRAAGFITAHDRDGNLKTFPLLSASAVLLALPAGTNCSVDEISAAIAAKKKAAKASPTKLALAHIGGC